MQGLILAAGRGSRLRPLTCIMAKPALRVIDRPLIWHITERLVRLGVSSILITLYHEAGSVLTLGLDTDFDVPVKFLVEPELLGTGGGVRNAVPFITEDQVLICNGDTLWDFDPRPAIAEHMKYGYDLTLILTTTPAWRDYAAIRMDEHSRVVRIGTLAEIPGRTGHLSLPYTFTGMYVLKTSLLKFLPSTCSFDFVQDFIVPLMMKGINIHGSPVEGFWADLGTFERYLNGILCFASRVWSAPVEYVVGQDCNIGKGAQITNSILWDGVSIAPHTSLRNCIAVDQVRLDTTVQIENTLLLPDNLALPCSIEYKVRRIPNTLAFPFPRLNDPLIVRP